MAWHPLPHLENVFRGYLMHLVTRWQGYPQPIHHTSAALHIQRESATCMSAWSMLFCKLWPHMTHFLRLYGHELKRRQRVFILFSFESDHQRQNNGWTDVRWGRSTIMCHLIREKWRWPSDFMRLLDRTECEAVNLLTLVSSLVRPPWLTSA